MSKPEYRTLELGGYANYTHAPFCAVYNKEDGMWAALVYSDGGPNQPGVLKVYHFGPKDTRAARGIHRLVDGLLLTLKVAHAPAT